MRIYGVVTGLALFASVPVEAAPEPVAPKPRIELATLFGSDAYPPLAITLGEDGLVVAALTIDPLGAVTACRIVTSSDSTSLDAATCRIMTEHKTAFSPAYDAEGNAVAGSYTLKTRWILPEPPPSPLNSVGQRLTLLLSNKAVIKRCELRDMPGNVAVEAMTMCAGFREYVAAMIGGNPETSPPGDVEVLALIDRTIGQAAPLSGAMPAGITLIQDVGSEFVVQPDGTRTGCTPVSTMVVETMDEEDAKSADPCVSAERFVAHQGAPIKVQDRMQMGYRLIGRPVGK